MAPFLFLLLGVTCAFGGRITPKTSNPISLSYNNAGAVSGYTFSFQIESDCPSGSTLVITFPSDDYSIPLNSGSVACANDYGDIYSCSVSGRAVTVQIGELSNVPVDNTHTVIVQNIINPTDVGGTGLFSLATFKGINVLDYHDYFGTVGIVEAYTPPGAASINCILNCSVGQPSSTYQFSFRNSKPFAADAKIVLKFPTSLDLSYYVACTSDQVPNLRCYKNDSNEVTITGFSSAVAAETAITINFPGIDSPYMSGSIGNFVFSILDALNNNLIHKVDPLAGPTLITGSVTAVTMTMTHTIDHLALSSATYKNKYWYTISGTTSTVMSAGGAILIQLPTLLTYTDNSCYAVAGLTHQGDTEDTQIKCSLNSGAKTLTIIHLGQLDPGTFTVKVLAETPTTGGATTTAASIKVYNDEAMTVLLDQGTAAAGITLGSLAAPNKWDFSWKKPSTSRNIQIVFRPQVNITIPSSTLYIKLPTGYTTAGNLSATLDIATATATVASSGSPILLTVTITGTGTISSTVDTTLTITSDSTGFTSSTTTGTYYLQMWIENVSNVKTDFLVYVDEVYGPDFTTSTIVPFSLDIAQMTVYVISLTPTIVIPTTDLVTSITVPQGRIDVQFPTIDASGNLLWKTDLGTGFSSGSLISCRNISGFVILDGEELICKLYVAAGETVSDYAVVQVSNFVSILAGTAVKLYIGGVQNPRTAVASFITVVSQSVKQTSTVQINRSVISAGTFYNDQDADLPVYNGKSPTSYGGDGTNKVVFSDYTVSAGTTMKFVLNLELDLTSNNYLIAKIPAGFGTLPNTGITCFKDYDTTIACLTLPVSSWIVFPELAAITSQEDFTITIKGLTNPIHVVTLTDFSIVAITEYQETEYIMFPSFEPFVSGTIISTITPDSYSANNVNTSYTWIFTLKHDLPAGGKIVLTFPEDNYVLTTTPTPECTIAGSLERLSASSPLVCSYDSNFMTITNYKSHTAGSSIFVSILHVLNPPEPVTTGYFEIASYSSSGYLIDQNKKISPLTITIRKSISQLAINGFLAYPTNGSITADYTVSFTPNGTVPKYSEISISFPSGEFNSFTTGSVACKVSGGLATVDSCVVKNSNQIIVTTDTIYQDSGIPIYITFYDILSFTPGLTSGTVSVDISYSGVIFQESPSAVTNRRFTTTASTGTLIFKTVTFSPNTEAVPGNYKFEISPTISLDTSSTVNIKFSDIFPRYLGDSIQCFSDEIGGSDGKAECSAVDRVLTIQVAKAFTAAQNKLISIAVMHIVNPNVDSAFSYITAYTMSGNSILDKGTLFTTAKISTKSGVMYYTVLSSTSTNIQQLVDMTMTATTTVTYTSSVDDKLLIDFPEDYDISLTADSLTCDSKILTETTTDVCEVENNRIVLKAFSSVATALQVFPLVVNSIENPAVVGGARYPTLYLYKSSSDSVIARTYTNLNKVPALGYDQTGIYLEINYDRPWTVNKGTTLEDLVLTIEIDSPGEVSISTVPPEGITITPNPIVLHIGNTYANFEVSVSQAVEIGTYELKWSIDGDWPIGYFAPLNKSYFDVTGDKESISLGEVNLVNIGGHSLPIPVTLSKSVHTEVTVNIKSLSSLPTLMTITPDSLTFLPGELEKTFQISLDVESQGYEGQIFLSKSGTDSAAYYLISNLISFKVAPEDIDSPVIQSCIVYSRTRNSVTFRAIVNEPVQILYGVGLSGTLEPSYNEYLNQMSGDELSYTPVYGDVFEYTELLSGGYQFEWTVDSLAAQTGYILHAQAYDLGGNFAETSFSVDFSTLERYRTADFRIRFEEYPIEDETKLEYMETLAGILKLDVSLLEVRNDYSSGTYTDFEDLAEVQTDAPLSTTSNGNRQTVESTIIYSDIDYLIYPDPLRDLGKSPTSYAQSLENLSYLIKASIPTFKEDKKITTSEILGIEPVFLVQPKLKEISDTEVSIDDISLSSPGIVYMCVMNSYTKPYEPSSIQVVSGVDGRNEACDIVDSFSYEESSAEVKFEGEYGETYWVYISATNNIQRYPDVATEVKMVKLNIAKKVFEDEFDESASYLSWLGLLLGLFLV